MVGVVGLDHVTAIVADADDAARVFRILMPGTTPATVVLPAMDIRSVALPETGPELHLNAPTGPGPVETHLTTRGPSLHHLALRVEQLDRFLEDLAPQGIRASGSPVVTAPGLREVFLDPATTAGLRIQLVERTGRTGPLDPDAVTILAGSGR
jgi:catechol 2,3-dioxygenase-like lactoylglutathione lyase family enzyme